MGILFVSLAVTLTDQVTKILVQRAFAVGERRPVLPGWFDLIYVQNTGAAWGMFQGSSAVLVLLSVVMLGVLVSMRQRLTHGKPLACGALGLIVGGITGNLLDRIRWGYVIDFLDFYWRQHHFPAFNVADSAICVGVALYLLTQRFGPWGGSAATTSVPEAGP